MTTVYYEIRVAGPVPPGALRGFEQISADLVAADTVLRGRLPDRAALNGLLTRLESCGVQLMAVRRSRRQACARRAPARSAGRPEGTPRAVTLDG